MSKNTVNVRVEYLLDKPIAEIFAMLEEHENYHRFPGFTESTLLEPGRSECNVDGALRRLAKVFERQASQA